MPEPSAALIERTERLLRQGSLGRTVGQLAALNRMLSDTTLAAIAPRSSIRPAPRDEALLPPATPAADTLPDTRSLALTTAQSVPLPSLHVPHAAADVQPESPTAEAEPLSAAPEPARAAPRRSAVAPVRLEAAVQPTNAVPPQLPERSPSFAAFATAAAAAPVASAAPDGHRVDQARARGPMITLAAPSVVTSNARATPLDGASSGSPQAAASLPPLEPAPDPTGTEMVFAPSRPPATTASLELARSTNAGAAQAHHARALSGGDAGAATPATDARAAEHAPAVPDQPAETHGRRGEAVVPGADLRWLADRLERLLRDEARAHGISV
jgi:hypothetical protein